jgi:hypothetical protein
MVNNETPNGRRKIPSQTTFGMATVLVEREASRCFIKTDVTDATMSDE